MSSKQLRTAIAAAALMGIACLLPAPASADGDGGYRLGSSGWDPGGGDFRWGYGPSLLWYSSGRPNYANATNYNWSWYYWSSGYGPYTNCAWNWRTHTDRRGNIIATAARCN